VESSAIPVRPDGEPETSGRLRKTATGVVYFWRTSQKAATGRSGKPIDLLRDITGGCFAGVESYHIFPRQYCGAKDTIVVLSI
jgi:hypothetical protein